MNRILPLAAVCLALSAAGSVGGDEILPPATAISNPSVVLLSVRLPHEEAPNAVHAAARIYADLEQARFRTEAALCPEQAVSLGEVVEEIGPVLATREAGEAWFYRRTWQVGAYSCGGNSLNDYLQRLSSHLPQGVTLQAG